MYVVARTLSNRPTLMHKLAVRGEFKTQCGLDMSGWSRAYFPIPVPQILCKKCGE